ncbi:hypothetical protein H0B56_19180 [Haloechinothrix sp. YIM 98757]|uniref:Uncharacterized protein n=1 Tax=Haloechinothrix aidingensis TaxID=2752311 RepID=A0A838AEG7_9PSEU|nr:hypothetical protein [Haloechinothrix aidingensis]MBA0127672.1 hypothetical protein [Haloechinothrix aidingensis]
MYWIWLLLLFALPFLTLVPWRSVRLRRPAWHRPPRQGRHRPLPGRVRDGAERGL